MIPRAHLIDAALMAGIGVCYLAIGVAGSIIIARITLAALAWADRNNQ